nr:retrovirus-related Pol polyprotein from transposon TNT 1-94 [Tanacetum cinerariifolium]
ESTEGTPQLGPERPRVYSDLKSEEKDRYNADIRATNVLLQGQHKEESIHDYYVRFAKLINDMRNIKMTMSKVQLNFKFVNNMLPEWGRFVMAVKLNRGLRDSNYDQLFDYLKQHEAHAKENKMILERLSQSTAQPTADPLTLLSNVSNTQHGGPDNAFDDDVDEQPVQDLALNVDNVFQDEDCDAFDSDVQDHDQYLDDTCDYQEEHVMHDSYVKDNDVPVVHSNASSVQNDTFMMIYNDMCEPSTSFVSLSSRNAVVKNSLTAELATYREQVKLPLYNDLNKVAISYKNPLCLTRTKQAQPALYNGHEILKDNHAPAKVHNAEDTLEIAEITRKKMNAKMTDPECVTHKVKIAPHDYTKENLLATFTS